MLLYEIKVPAIRCMKSSLSWGKRDGCVGGQGACHSRSLLYGCQVHTWSTARSRDTQTLECIDLPCLLWNALMLLRAPRASHPRAKCVGRPRPSTRSSSILFTHTFTYLWLHCLFALNGYIALIEVSTPVVTIPRLHMCADPGRAGRRARQPRLCPGGHADADAPSHSHGGACHCKRQPPLRHQPPT